jgi:cyclopropane-fatty-acyl-phospholipid synthase
MLHRDPAGITLFREVRKNVWMIKDALLTVFKKYFVSPALRPLKTACSWLLRKVFEMCGQPPIRLTLYDGSEIGCVDHEPVATLHIRDRTTLLKLALAPETQFGEAYMAGNLEVEGRLSDLLEAVFLGQGRKDPSPYSSLRRWCYHLVRRRRANSMGGARSNIHHHYDVGNDFYALWLDKEMQYSCAHFPHRNATLEEAQLSKMEHVCRKVWLQPGDRVVEAGCGWGSLARHMVLQHGAQVRAFSISHEQIAYCRERAKAEGWDKQVEFIEDDYRNITGQYDVFMAVGLVEHVDPFRYKKLGALIARSLNSSGRGLVHNIGRNRFTPMQPWMERRIFPGTHPPSLREMMSIFEASNLSVIDVENLRLQYAKTLVHWIQRFEDNINRIHQMFDDQFIRAWRLYLESARAGFLSGQLQLFQIAFCPSVSTRIPLTRSHLYVDQDALFDDQPVSLCQPVKAGPLITA